MIPLSEEEIRSLIDRAKDMLRYAYIPYSHFSVGAALLAENGSVYTGCNIENAAFTGTSCAERTAVFKAVSEGVREFRAIAIAGGHMRAVTDFCPPCGVCRQVLMEFCDPDTFQIILAGAGDAYRVCTLGELLPMGFGPANLG